MRFLVSLLFVFVIVNVSGKESENGKESGSVGRKESGSEKESENVGRKEWRMAKVDLHRVGLHKAEPDEIDYAKTGRRLVEELKKYGVLYLINHGLPENKIQEARRVAREFFLLPESIKWRSHRKRSDIRQGWKRTGLRNASDWNHRESLDIHRVNLDTFPWPDEDVIPGFRERNLDLMANLETLGHRLLRSLDVVLSPVKHELQRAHALLGHEGNMALLKHLYYLPVTGLDDDHIATHHRLEEHTDWGTLTLLFQDETGGLQFKHADEYLPVEPLEGAILLQSADMLQLWTHQQIISVPHRIVLTPETKNKTRESMAYFITPDDNFKVEPLDGSPGSKDMAHHTVDRLKLERFDNEDYNHEEL